MNVTYLNINYTVKIPESDIQWCGMHDGGAHFVPGKNLSNICQNQVKIVRYAKLPNASQCQEPNSLQ